MECLDCRRENRDGARFCDACGADLARPGDRRQLTVLFVDLVESTPLAGRVDAEDLRDLIQALQSVAARAIQTLGGHVAQYLGDGIVAYFGHPRAHEDDASRALQAGLRILAELPALNERARGAGAERIRVRLAAHSGEVVVAEMGAGAHRETLALGETVNVSARLLHEAEADTLVVSDATRCLVGSDFELDDLGERSLRGVKNPVRVFRVERPSDPQTRLLATPLVGREGELRRLAEWMEASRSGRGRPVVIEGDPGIGKSRLVVSFLERLGDGASLIWASSRQHEDTAFHTIRSGLRKALDLDDASSPDHVAESLERAFAKTKLPLAETVEAVAQLMSLPLPAQRTRVGLGPDVRRRLGIEAVTVWLRTGAEERGLALIVEDLHWADPSTLEVLGQLIETCGEAPLLLLMTVRTGFVAPWSDHAAETLQLGPLERADVATLVDLIAGEGRLAPALRNRVVEGTDGVPLFVEELTRAVVESGGGAGAEMPLAVPATLRDSLTARLDNLGPARELAQFASVIGRRFSRELLEMLSTLERAAFESALHQLLASGLVHRDPDSGFGGLIFKHALVQEVAYRSLLRERRRELHGRFVDGLNARYPERVAAEPDQLAWHCEGAGRIAEAVGYLKRAGERALAQSAHREALSHLERGLELVAWLPDSPERARLEMGFLVTMGAPVAAVRGWGHPDLESTQVRALELSRQVGSGPDLYQALGTLYMFYGPRADLDRAGEVAEQLRRLGAEEDQPFVGQMGEGFSGLLEFYRGHLNAAREHIDRMLDREPRAGVRPDWYIHDTEPQVLARCTAGMTLALLGRKEDALRMGDEAIWHGRASKNPFNLAFALQFAGLAFHSLDLHRRVRECAEEAVELCSTQGYPALLPMVRVLHACGRAREAVDCDEVSEIQQGLSEGSRVGVFVEAPRVMGILGEALWKAGQSSPALDAVRAGLRLAGRHGTHYWDAELLRLSAEFMLASGGEPSEASRTLRSAAQTARAQGAGLLLQRIVDSAEHHGIDWDRSEP